MTGNVAKVRNAMLAVQRYPWEQGVCMQALYEMGDIDTAIAMAHDAVLRQKEDGRLAVINDNIAVTDPAANGVVVQRAYKITGDEFYGEAARRMLSYLNNKAPRTDNGTLCHNEISFQEGFSPDQIWADSIYMAPPFLAEMGCVSDAVNQIKGVFGYLLDESSGVLRHIYDATQKRFVRDKLWATGSGWALMGCAAVADIIRVEGFQTEAEELDDISKNLLDSMLNYQLPDGRFHDILDEEDSFVDGASAMMMSAFIYRRIVAGTLDIDYRKYADIVVDTMEQYVDNYGIIREVCGCPHFVSSGTSAESMAAYIMMHAWRDKL